MIARVFVFTVLSIAVVASSPQEDLTNISNTSETDVYNNLSSQISNSSGIQDFIENVRNTANSTLSEDKSAIIDSTQSLQDAGQQILDTGKQLVKTGWTLKTTVPRFGMKLISGNTEENE